MDTSTSNCMMNRLYVILTMFLCATQSALGIHQQQYCPLVDFPIKKLSDTETCFPDSVGKQPRRITELDATVDMTSFVQYPSKGQRLILVPRNSDLTIILDDNVAYQLRQRQQLHNPKSDDFMDVPLQTNGYTVLSQDSEENNQQYDSNHTIDFSETEKIFSTKDVVPLLLKSHPGQALVPLQPDPIGGGAMLEQLDFVEIGIGPENEAIHIRLREPEVLTRKGGTTNDDTFRYVLVNTDGLVLIVSSSQLKVGSPVTMTSWLNKEGRVDEIDIMVSHFVTNFYHRCPFIVNTDGSISPLEAPHLSVGISRFPAVTLLERFSPNRLIIQNATTFWNAPAPVNGTALVLKSHPGLAVVTYPRYRGAFGLANMMDVLVGPANNEMYRTLHLFPRDRVHHHEFTLRDAYGSYLVPMNMNLHIDVPLRLLKYNVSGSTVVNTALSFVLQSERIATWKINLEGSISPLNAPHLVLGCRHVFEYVDRDLATQQRLTWQSNAVEDDTKNKSVDPSTSIVDDNRLVHGFVWFLIVEDYFRYVALILAVTVIAVIKLVPMSIWILLLLQLTLGPVACSFYIGFKIGSLATRAVVKRFKKNNMQEVVEVR